MTLATMQDLFVEQLKEMYSAEKQLARALPRLAKAAKSAALTDALDAHLNDTELQLKRLERVFKLAGRKPAAKHCLGMEGLVAEGVEAIYADGQETLIDANIIAAVQRMKHYEMAAYASLIRYANNLGNLAAARLLRDTFDEERGTDDVLNKLNEELVLEPNLSGDLTPEEAAMIAAETATFAWR